MWLDAMKCPQWALSFSCYALLQSLEWTTDHALLSANVPSHNAVEPSSFVFMMRGLA